MAQHHYVERAELDGGGAGVILGILVGVLVIALLFVFLVLPGRFGPGSTTTQPSNSTININPSVYNPSDSQPNTAPGLLP